MKNKGFCFIAEALLVLVLIFANGCGQSADAMSLFNGSHVTEQESVYDAKSGSYVTKTQYQLYHGMDTVKRAGGIFSMVMLIGCFLFRRIDRFDGKLRTLALFLELSVPGVYLLVIYVGSYLFDRFL